MTSPHPPPSRDDLASRYLDQLPYEPYRVQEEALLAWFSAEQGVLVCAPTGTGKTLIAEAALFEALHTGKTAYYTTPLIALTEQKFREMQTLAVKWGFQPTDVGLVTGNRRENPDARVLVVVAEILLNRLLHTAAFDFSEVGAVVMDEFHSFADLERGMVWELALGLLPAHVRTLLLSATVGNAADFLHWLRQSHQRRLELVTGDERKVPLRFHWVGDMLLTEQIEEMAAGEDEVRRTPALIFCFNREECWTVAEQLKGKGILGSGQQAQAEQGPGRLRLVGGRRSETQTAPGARRGRASCRRAAQVSPGGRRTVSKKAAFRGRLHRDAFLGHQSAGAIGGRAEHYEGAAGQRNFSIRARPTRFSAGRAVRSSIRKATCSCWPTRTT